MEKISLNEICKRQHEMAKSKGFYEKPRELGTLLMLIVSELGEALEADRKERFANMAAFEQYTKTTSEPQKIEAFKLFVKDTLEDELADVFIRMFDLCGYLGIDIEKHIEHKMWYNSTRQRLHGKAY